MLRRAELLSCNRHGIECTHQCAGVLLQNLTVDVLDRHRPDGSRGRKGDLPHRRTSWLGSRTSTRLRRCKDPGSVCPFGRIRHRQIQNDLQHAPRRSNYARENQRGTRAARWQPIHHSQQNSERSARSWASRTMSLKQQRCFTLIAQHAFDVSTLGTLEGNQLGLIVEGGNFSDLHRRRYMTWQLGGQACYAVLLP